MLHIWFVMENMTYFEMQMLEFQREILAELKGLANILSIKQPSDEKNEKMTRADVKAYLGIGESTYKLRVKDGTLKPRKLPGGHLYFKHELEEARRESIKKGKV